MTMSISFKRVALGLLVISTQAYALGPFPVILGSSANYVILAKSGVSTVPQSAINGNIGLSPASGTLFTGFALTKSPTNQFATSPQVNGSLFAADYTTPTPSLLTSAVSDMQTAYTDASTRSNPNFLNLKAGDLSGLTLTAGLYKWTSGVTIPTSITISGTPADTWIFQIAGTLNMASSKQVILAGGAVSQNIVWVVAGNVAIGSGAHIEGIVLGKTAVTLQTGSSINGRLLAQTAVALQSATVNQVPVVIPPVIPQCAVGSILCCQKIEQASLASVLLALLGIDLTDLTALVGVTCTPLSASGLATGSCTAVPACCLNNGFSGKIALGCTPL